MQQCSAVVQIKRLLTVVLDKLHRGRGGPFRIMTLERRLNIVPINILGPCEPEILHSLPIALLIFKFFAVERRREGYVFLNLVQAVFLPKLCITERRPYMKFPHHARGVPGLSQQRRNVLIVRFQFHVEARQALLPLGEKLQKFR